MRCRNSGVRRSRWLRWHLVAISALMVVLLPACATTTSAARFETATLYGIVVDESHDPVQWAAVTVAGNDPASTGIDGRFAVPDVAPGWLTIVSNRDGYDAHESKVLFTDTTQVVHIQIRSGRFYIRHAIEALERGDAESSARHAEHAVALLPSDPEARFVAAIAAYRAGDNAKTKFHLDWFPLPVSYEAVRLFRDQLSMSEAGAE